MGAQELAQTAREELVQKSSTCQVQTYQVRVDGGSRTTTIAPSVQNMLDIDDDTQLRQFVNVDANAIILIPK